MPQIHVNDINLYYESEGTCEALVLISGLGYPLWTWHKMVPYLAEHFRVISFDNRGVGLTDKPAGPYNVQMLAADTLALLDALEIEQAALVGHSMGGFVAQEIALTMPERVSKLVLCSSNFGGPNHVPMTQAAWAALTDVESDPLTRFKNGLRVSTGKNWIKENPEMIQAWIDWRFANPLDIAGYQAQMAVGLGLMEEDAAFEKRLSALQISTLLLFGADDQVVPPANAALLAEKIADSQTIILPGVGHFLPIEAAKDAAKAMIEFLK